MFANKKKMKIDTYQQVWNLWADYEDALKKYVFKYAKSEEVTKDIVQDTLLKVHKSCCSDKEIQNIRSWLFQIAYNSMMDFFKSERKATNLIKRQITDNQNDMYQELSVYIEPLIGFLPEKYGAALRMADIEGLKQQEIADKLNLSLSATKSRIQRGRKLLKEEIHSCFHTKESSNSGLTDFDLKESCTSLKNWEKKKN